MFSRESKVLPSVFRESYPGGSKSKRVLISFALVNLGEPIAIANVLLDPPGTVLTPGCF
jgi:hypothetical protein